MVDIDSNHHGSGHVEWHRLEKSRVDDGVPAANFAVDFQQEVVNVSAGHTTNVLQIEALRDDAKLLVAGKLGEAVHLR